MGFLLAVLSFVVAEEVVELEPVQATGACSEYNGNQANCERKWYCAYNESTNCIPDPCLKVQETDTGCEAPPAVKKEGVYCQFYPGAAGNLNLAKHDCKNPSSSGGYCASAFKATNGVKLDYCAYAAVRDGGTCPQSICTKDSAQDDKCFPHTSGTKCQLLSKEDCKLVPKCMVNGSQCSPDPCFSGRGAGGSTNENQICSDWIPTTPYPGADPWPASFAAGDCKKEYKPYTNSGGITTYCIYKDHSDDPNLCYFLGDWGNNTNSPNDYFVATGTAPSCTYTGTYPTYNEFGGCILNPECTATIAGCDGVKECTTKFIGSGAFAGAYCGDKEHGAASNLRIPSFLALLVVAIFAIFN